VSRQSSGVSLGSRVGELKAAMFSPLVCLILTTGD
jgi:hypothetical protein